ncbi:DUF563 domain-containing protein, partial [Ponticoccus gilvus]|nr:DUF563 domain-containing protein [Enemella evansiae]
MAEFDGSPALELEALHTRARLAVQAGRGQGALAFPDLDAACRALLARAAPPPPSAPAGPGPDILYLVTEIYPAGGHRLVLEQMIRARPGAHHAVAFTGLLHDRPRFGAARMAALGVPIFAPDPADTLWDKWMALRAHIAARPPGRIVLLHHSEDVIATLLAQELEPLYGANLLFLRHADTVASLGADLAGATHLAVRPAQAEALLARWPGLRVAHLPLVYDPEAPPPALVAEMPLVLARPHTQTGRRYRARRATRAALRRMVWSLRRTRHGVNRARPARRRRPPDLSGAPVTATCGTEHKFRRAGAVALPATIVALLRAGVRRHVHIGPATAALRAACHAALEAAGIPRKRLRFLGEVPSLADALRLQNVTLFLGSFPEGGALSRAEAAWLGVPIALCVPPDSEGVPRYLVGPDFAPTEVLTWRDPADLAAQLRTGFGPERRECLSRAALDWYEADLSPHRFATALAAVFDGLPPPVTALATGPVSRGETAETPGIRPAPVQSWLTETRPLLTRAGDAPGAAVAVPPCEVRVARPSVVAHEHIAQPGQIWHLPPLETICWPDAIAVGGGDGLITGQGGWYDPGLDGVDPEVIRLRDPGPVTALSGAQVTLRRGAPAQGPGLDRAILGTGCYSHNYFHFLLEVLPRVRLAATRAPADTPVVIEDDLPPQCEQALRLALPRHPLIRVRRGQSVRVRRLYAAGMGSVVNDLVAPTDCPPVAALRYHPEVIAGLREMARIGQGGDAPERLFLWREFSSRRLRNARALRARLEGLGFSVVDTAQLSFADQIRLMARARIIVAQSGAQLANLAFAPPGCRVIVLFSDAPGINFRLWSALGALIGQEVINIAGTRVGRLERGIHADFNLPETEILPFLDRAPP